MAGKSNIRFYIMLLVAIMGLVIPIWLSRPDTAARSLKLNVISRTALEPEWPTPMTGIQFTVDGKTLQRPYISVLSLVNNGSLPLTSDDYESPIEITVAKGTVVVRSRVTDTTPPDLLPQVEHNSQTVTIQPLLINPGDTINIALVTSGKIPEFSVRARIAGVGGVPIVNPTIEEEPGTRVWLGVATAFALMVSYGTLISALINGRPYALGRLHALFIGLASGLGSGIILGPIFRHFDLSVFQKVLALVAIIIIALLASTALSRRPANRGLNSLN